MLLTAMGWFRPYADTKVPTQRCRNCCGEKVPIQYLALDHDFMHGCPAIGDNLNKIEPVPQFRSHGVDR